MQLTPDQDRAEGDRAEGRPIGRREVFSGRLLLAGVVISELACFGLVVALVL